eukprot:SAG31_NODE_3026_length_4775_cov_1.849872_2_plen_515_part_00
MGASNSKTTFEPTAAGRVELYGLIRATQHNGKVGTVTHFDKEEGRYIVVLDEGGKEIAVRPFNIRALGPAGGAYGPGERYEGQWKDNKPHGQGVRTWADGARYEGQFKDGLRHGHGVYTGPTGCGSASKDAPATTAATGHVLVHAQPAAAGADHQMETELLAKVDPPADGQPGCCYPLAQMQQLLAKHAPRLDAPREVLEQHRQAKDMFDEVLDAVVLMNRDHKLTATVRRDRAQIRVDLLRQQLLQPASDLKDMNITPMSAEDVDACYEDRFDRMAPIKLHAFIKEVEAKIGPTDKRRDVKVQARECSYALLQHIDTTLEQLIALFHKIIEDDINLYHIRGRQAVAVAVALGFGVLLLEEFFVGALLVSGVASFVASGALAEGTRYKKCAADIEQLCTATEHVRGRAGMLKLGIEAVKDMKEETEQTLHQLREQAAAAKSQAGFRIVGRNREECRLQLPVFEGLVTAQTKLVEASTELASSVAACRAAQRKFQETQDRINAKLRRHKQKASGC